MRRLQLNRREAMASLLAISAAGALGACSNGADNEAAADAVSDLKFASPTAFFTDAEMEFLSAVANTLIPDTETAGAVGAGVPETLQSLASVWGDNDYRVFWRRGIRDLKDQLQDGSGTDFLNQSEAVRTSALAAHDADVFSGQVDDGFYRSLKATVVQAYYMSEVGASEELAYEPVPGDWKGCVPLSDYPKTWAT